MEEVDEVKTRLTTVESDVSDLNGRVDKLVVSGNPNLLVILLDTYQNASLV